MTQLIASLGIVLAALVSGVVAWTIARRTSSGKIDTSQAATLWDEGTIMRKELRDEVVTLKTQLTEAIKAVTTLNMEITHSRQETEAAREETRKSREETRILMAQIAALHVETKNVLTEVQTSNALSIGALADNIESRRILDIPIDERTEQEKIHLATAKDRLPADLRATHGTEEA